MKRRPQATPSVGRKTAGPNGPRPRRRAIFTIASANYIAYAATLMQSVRNFHPDVQRYIVLADAHREFPDIDLAAELLSCDRIGTGLVANMQLWYTVVEINTAIKPFFFLDFMERQQFDQVVFLDPDILLFRPLTEVFDSLESHNIVLTPHITMPLPQDGKVPTDHSIMKSGIYNLGFLGAHKDTETLALLRWWSDRCLLHCQVDIAANLFTDQRWMDLAPMFVAKPMILRHPGYNVAHWNLPHRDIQQAADGSWMVNGQALVFFHFSGIDPGDPKQFSKHQNRYDIDTLGPTTELCRQYRELLMANHWHTSSQLRYGFATFPDGRPIEDAMRQWLRRVIDAGHRDPMKPLSIDSRYFDRPDEEATGRGAEITRFMYQLWLSRLDLRQAFDIFTPSGCSGYINWFINGDARRQGIDERSIAAARRLAAGKQTVGVPETVPRIAPPWPPVGTRVWRGAARDAGAFLQGNVEFALDGDRFLIPIVMALIWELRSDLQTHFRLRDIDSLHRFISWALTHGVSEGEVDPHQLSPEFLDQLTQTSGFADDHGDVPVTLGLSITQSVEIANQRYHYRQQFPVDRIGRLAHGLWFAYIAPKQFNWPRQIVARILAYFEENSTIGFDGFFLNRATLAIWELREDIRQAHPLNTDDSIREYLIWLLTHGLEEMGLSLDQLGVQLRDFLLSPAPRYTDIKQIHEIIYRARGDLQQIFSIATDAGRNEFANWLTTHFLPASAGTPVAELFQPAATPATEQPILHTATVALSGQWSAPTGRGEDLRCSAQALLTAGFADFLIVDTDTGTLRRPDGSALEENVAVEVDVNVMHYNAETAYHDWRRMQALRVSSRRAIGFWAWELEQLPSYWRATFSFYDEIWAASQFAQKAFAEPALRPVRLMPMAVIAPHGDRQVSRRELGLPDDATIFLFMFDFQSYVNRKNPEAVVHAFLRGFPAGDENVHLLIKTMGGAKQPDKLNRLRSLCADPRISLRDIVLQRDELTDLVNACDAFVSLHRSEGFGRAPAEAMLQGKPIIITDYSGTSDFATKDCAYLVDYKLVPVASDQYPGVERQRWADPNLAQAAAHMRRIHDDPEEARRVGERGRAQITRLLSPAVVGQQMRAALEDPAPR
jgi:glycosyltransferase involved in cell wall biosynthesis